MTEVAENDGVLSHEEIERLADNHFTDVPVPPRVRLDQEWWGPSKFVLEFTVISGTDEFPMELVLDLTGSEPIENQLYRSYFRSQAATSFGGRMLVLPLLLVYPGFPISLFTGSWYISHHVAGLVRNLPFYARNASAQREIEHRHGMTRHTYAKLQAFKDAGLSERAYDVLYSGLQRLDRWYAENGG